MLYSFMAGESSNEFPRLTSQLPWPKAELPPGSEQVAAQAYPGYATVVSPVAGYQLSLEVNLGGVVQAQP